MSFCAVRYLALVQRASAHRGLSSGSLSAHKNGGSLCSKHTTVPPRGQIFVRLASNLSPSNEEGPVVQDSSLDPVVTKESTQATDSTPPDPSSPALPSSEIPQKTESEKDQRNLPSPPDSVRDWKPDGITLLPIDLPGPVSAWPTPWFQKEDVQKYFIPLYSRGWGVYYQRDYKNGMNPEFTAELVVRYEVKDYASAVRFVSEIAAIAETEKHHPTFLSITNQERPEVMVVTQTDSARRPLSHRLEARKMPGVTRRDLRLAYLIETLYEKFATDSPRRIMESHERPRWSKMISVFRAHVPPERFMTGRKAKCTACGGPHVVQQCPTPAPARREVRAPLCSRCGQRHRSQLCPQRLVGGPQPLRPCPNCQGHHWLVDCREPQMSKEIAEELMLPIPET